MKLWDLTAIAFVAGIVGIMGLAIDKKNDRINQLTKAVGVCKEAIRPREAPCRDCSDAERGREQALARLSECDGRLGELIGHKCDPCKLRVYAETLKHEPHVMFGPARFTCPPEAPVIWLDPDYGIGGDWAYICTPETQ